ncbi:MAG: hypothetical protein KJ728_11975 [Alphaproteobacteria bacterium]|uniref:Uncharacterized protein n=1 Tax=viral metagenome TaxID=1070528 RepID=A0A6M3XBP5_9ZZZZ|nr:hypothetical protein [Alphaproteobacteria bacterium]
MALNKNQLSKVANLHSVTGAAASRQQWHYDATADSVATVVAAGYFNDVRGYLMIGDVINVVAATSAAFRVLTVTAVPKTGNVTVSAAAFS